MVFRNVIDLNCSSWILFGASCLGWGFVTFGSGSRQGGERGSVGALPVRPMPAGRVNRGPQEVSAKATTGSLFQNINKVPKLVLRRHFLQQPRSKVKRIGAKGRSRDKSSSREAMLHWCEPKFISQLSCSRLGTQLGNSAYNRNQSLKTPYRQPVPVRKVHVSKGCRAGRSKFIVSRIQNIEWSVVIARLKGSTVIIRASAAAPSPECRTLPNPASPSLPADPPRSHTCSCGFR